MSSCDDILRDMERPPSRGHITIWSIIEIILLIYLGLKGLKGIYDLFAGNYKLSLMDIILVIVNGLLLLGLIFIVHGFFADSRSSLKTGFMCFMVGIVFIIFDVILDICFGGSFSFDSVLNLCFLIFLSFILYQQSSRS